MAEEYKTKLDYLSKIEKVSATSAVLVAASFFIGSECKHVSDDFMICNSKIQDPEKCLEKGILVSKCVNQIISDLNTHCKEEFTKYWQCLDMNNQQFLYCRDEERQLNDVVTQKLGWKKKLWKGFKPEHGYKPDNELPGADTWQYRFHVRFNKSY